MKDYYSILGVSRTASDSEIKRAFRRLAIRYHPDKNPDPVAKETFVAINEAYETIGDPLRRSAYDDRLANPLSELIVEEPRPQHRDPAYRRPRPAAPPSPRYSESDTIRHYLKYVHWWCWVGMVSSAIFFIDYFLPRQVAEETIMSERITRGRRGGVAYIISYTESGKKIKHYPLTRDCVLFVGNRVLIERTLVYRTPMKALSIDDQGVTETLGYMYGALAFMPLVMLLSGAGGLVFQHRTTLAFNMTFVCFVFSIFTFVFI